MTVPGTTLTPTGRGPRTASARTSPRVTTVVETSDLAIRYGERVDLSFPDITLAPRERLVLTGPSGSGKSTLLHILAGLVRPTSGRALVAGIELTALSPAELERARSRRVGIVFQDLHLAEGFTAVENVTVALAAAGVPLGASRTTAVRLLRELDLGHRLGARPRQLSTGERQRVAIARAVAAAPVLLLADEPTAHLDRDRAEAGLELLFDTAARVGAALIVTTHDPRVIGRFERHAAFA